MDKLKLIKVNIQYANASLGVHSAAPSEIFVPIDAIKYLTERGGRYEVKLKDGYFESHPNLKVSSMSATIKKENLEVL